VNRPPGGPGPLSLLAASLLPVLGGLAIRSAEDGLVCLAVLVALSPFLVGSWPSTLRRAAVVLLFGGSIALSTWLYGGHDPDAAAGAALRIAYIVLPGAMLTPSIGSSALGDHLAQRLRLPARAVVASSAALERFELLGEQWRQVGRARRARGVGADGNLVRRVRVNASMTVALLVSTMRLSGAMALAMDARGFAGAQRRTWAEPAPWRPADTALLALGVVLAALPWLLRLAPG
jgi:energy-coupling factor transporter transmembrane protein EcfT